MSMKYRFNGLFYFLMFCLFSACSNSTTSEDAADTSATTDSNTVTTGTLKPKGDDPAWAPGIDDEMLVVIEKLQSYVDKPIETLSATEARHQHTPADAVMDVMKEN